MSYSYLTLKAVAKIAIAQVSNIQEYERCETDHGTNIFERIESYNNK